MFGECLLWPCFTSQKSNFSSNLTIVQPVTQESSQDIYSTKTIILCFQQMVIMVSDVKLNSILPEQHN